MKIGWKEGGLVGYLENDPPRVVVLELHSPAKHWSAQILGIKNDYFIAELELTGKDAAVNSSIFEPRVGRCMLPDIAILDPLIMKKLRKTLSRQCRVRFSNESLSDTDSYHVFDFYTPRVQASGKKQEEQREVLFDFDFHSRQGRLRWCAYLSGQDEPTGRTERLPPWPWGAATEIPAWAH